MNRLSLTLTVALALTPIAASAHKIIAAVFPSGTQIEGEIGFSNGDMAKNVVVNVLRSDGSKIGETTTDADGFFTYTPTEETALEFRSDLGAGHVATAEMSLEDVARVMGHTVTATEAPVVQESSDAPVVAGGLTPVQVAEVADMLRDELRPLRREIAAYREKNDLQTILGGIGYIIGLFGLVFYIAARRRLQDAGKGAQ
ncbi:cobalt ABC transporter permease [Donghicola sp. C2-DW-16]|uniref:Cobalt ABC transporter permease n=1 Tax=Donghicola mangrovi TaxID=2729614 RepID=A0ABX2PGJ2_9RHOB|nr:cobalt ABC transporter permease [Donghicola mangrovi]NVO28618.1 cobalt ABC transporter permease [Donghicola mangrovi]